MPIPVLDVTRTPYAFKPRRPLSDVLVRVQFVLLCVLLLFGPLAFGAVEDWSMLVLHLGAAVLFAVFALEQLLTGEVVLPSASLLVPMILFGLLILLQCFGLSAEVLASRSEALNVFAYMAIFVVAWRCFTSLQRARQFAAVVAVFGFLVAVFGMVQDFTSNNKLYWLRQPRDAGWMYGPYVNHSHFAGLMELLVPFGIVIAFGAGRDHEKRGLWGFAGLVMALAIVLSGSRGGLLGFAVELVFFFALYGWFSGTERSPRKIVAGIVFVAVIAVLVVWFGRDIHLRRIEALQHPLDTAGARVQVLSDGLHMWKAKPVLGWGLATFPSVYPKYKTFYSLALFNAAHNDYLQLGIETGILGLGAALAFLVAIYLLARRAIRNSESTTGALLKFAALVGCTGIVVHSFSDFNMQIPANAAMFFALAAFAAAPFRHLSRRRRTASNFAVLEPISTSRS